MNSNARTDTLGIGMVLLAAILLGAKGVIAKRLYALGLDYTTVVAVRAVLAVPGFLLLAVIFAGKQRLLAQNPRDLAWACAAGVLCYYGGAGLNFYALTLIDASVERALLFSYPAMVVIVEWIRQRQRPDSAVLLAVVVTWVGIALTVGLFATDVDASERLGGLLVLVCAASIAVYFFASASLTQSMGSAPFTLVAMSAAGAAWAIHYQISHGWAPLTLANEATYWMAFLIVAVTILPLYLIAEGVRRIGALRGSIASTVGPPAAALLAVWLLGESLTPERIGGIILIVVGILVLERHRVQVANSAVPRQAP